MGDLISRSALLEEFKEPGFLMSFIIRHTIEKAPAVDAEPVRHGRWHVCLGGKVIECTVCTGTFFDENGNELPNYCPNCGAKMDGDKDAAD